MSTLGAFTGVGRDDFRQKISEANPSVELTLEPAVPERGRAGGDGGLIHVTGHSGRILEDPHATPSGHTAVEIPRRKADLC